MRRGSRMGAGQSGHDLSAQSWIHVSEENQKAARNEIRKSH
jgi:hypothetical protein